MSVDRRELPTPQAFDRIGFLINKVKRHDVDAFVQLCAAVSGALMYTALKFEHDFRDSEELVEDTLFNVWRYADTYDSRMSKGKTWITSILINKRIDALRNKERRLQFKPLPDGAEGMYPDPSENLHDKIIDFERQRQVRLAMQSLPPEQETAVELHFIEGLTDREVSRKMKSPLGTTKSRFRYARNNLRDMLTPEGDLVNTNLEDNLVVVVKSAVSKRRREVVMRAFGWEEKPYSPWAMRADKFFIADNERRERIAGFSNISSKRVRRDPQELLKDKLQVFPLEKR